jgi:hypothetical protein
MLPFLCDAVYNSQLNFQALYYENVGRINQRRSGMTGAKVALGQFFSLRVLRFTPANIIPPLFHIHLCINWRMDC